jgi:glycosyltransferase involved in cell wall biosynthesis
VSRQPPSFDLVVATVGRIHELDRLLVSLGLQTHEPFRILLVDQNEDDLLLPLLATYPQLDVERVRSGPGLSRARNAALPYLTADVVAFPDDDCVYPATVLERVAEQLAARPELDGLTGRAVDADGSSAGPWKTDAAVLTRDNLWNRAISYTIFVRRDLLERVGPFDERLGLGSGEPWGSGEEIDLLLRALELGARIEYEPELEIEHERRAYTPELAARDGASVGYLLRKHRYGRRMVARMLVRPLGGALLSLLRLDPAQARIHLATLRGRIRGYRARSFSNSAR